MPTAFKLSYPLSNSLESVSINHFINLLWTWWQIIKLAHKFSNTIEIVTVARLSFLTLRILSLNWSKLICLCKPNFILGLIYLHTLQVPLLKNNDRCCIVPHLYLSDSKAQLWLKTVKPSLSINKGYSRCKLKTELSYIVLPVQVEV